MLNLDNPIPANAKVAKEGVILHKNLLISVLLTEDEYCYDNGGIVLYEIELNFFERAFLYLKRFLRSIKY